MHHVHRKILFLFMMASVCVGAATTYGSAAISDNQAGASATYLFSLNTTSSHTSFINITAIFPTGFDVSAASASSNTANLTGGNTTIAGQNVTYTLSEGTLLIGNESFNLTISGITNINVTGAYSLGIVTFNGTFSDGISILDNGAITIGIRPSYVAYIIIQNTTNTSCIAGTNVTINFTSLDIYGNPVNDTYNFSSSDSAANLPQNITANNTNVGFLLKTAGIGTISVRSNSNTSITNSTNVTVYSASIATVKATYPDLIVVVGVNFSGNFSSYDAFGNAIADTYNFTSVNSTLPDNGSVNTTYYNFSINDVGDEIITVFSNGNSTIANATTFHANGNATSSVTVTFSNLSTIAGRVIFANISSYDAENNSIVDSYTFSSSDGQAILPSNGNGNGTDINFTLKTAGSITITVTSRLNTSAANITTWLVNASTATQMRLTPRNTNIAYGAGLQFYGLLYDAYGNQNTTVAAGYSATSITGTGAITSAGYFTSTAAGIVMINSSYAGLTNATNVTIASAIASPSPTSDTSGSTGNTYVYSTPYPEYAVYSTATPTPTPRPTPTPATSAKKA
ncbi:MAG: hypothetical protein V1658_03680, partial [Candidatus Micrarchaeota archaeon]